jgi:RHS repeat-associated protein
LPLVTYTRGRDLSGSLQGAGGIGGLLARTDMALAIYNRPASAYYHADGNGNITALINSQQVLMAKYLYDPYGNILSQSGPLADANVYRFSSKEFHANSGLIYYLYRFYDPNLQRWLSRDPIGEAGGINLYRFCHNAGLIYVDPFGLADPAGAWVYPGSTITSSNGFTFTYNPPVYSRGATAGNYPPAFPDTPSGYVCIGSSKGSPIIAQAPPLPPPQYHMLWPMNISLVPPGGCPTCTVNGPGGPMPGGG